MRDTCIRRESGDSLNTDRLVHVSHQICKHTIGCLLFSLHVFQHTSFTLCRDNVDRYLFRLSKPITPSNSLVVLFVTVRWEEGYVGAILEIQPPRPYNRLADHHPQLALCEREELFLLRLIRICTAYLFRVRDDIRKAVALTV